MMRGGPAALTAFCPLGLTSSQAGSGSQEVGFLVYLRAGPVSAKDSDNGFCSQR